MHTIYNVDCTVIVSHNVPKPGANITNVRQDVNPAKNLDLQGNTLCFARIE